MDDFDFSGLLGSILPDNFNLTGLLSGAGQVGTALLPYYAGEGILDYLKQARTDLPTSLSTIETEALG